LPSLTAGLESLTGALCLATLVLEARHLTESLAWRSPREDVLVALLLAETFDLPFGTDIDTVLPIFVFLADPLAARCRLSFHTDLLALCALLVLDTSLLANFLALGACRAPLLADGL
jgi:hypothetical protein